MDIGDVDAVSVVENATQPTDSVIDFVRTRHVQTPAIGQEVSAAQFGDAERFGVERTHR